MFLTAITPSMPSRPVVARSKTMPAFRRALTLPSLEKPLASFYASSSRGLGRMPTPKASDASSATIRPSASIESMVLFTTPDYEEPAASGPPLTVPRPSFTRAMTLPAPVRALPSTVLLKLPSFNKIVCEAPRKASVMGIFASLMALLVILLLQPEMAAETPRRVPAPRPYERKITISEEQKCNPPKLHKSTPGSRIPRRVAKAYRRTLRRVARARRASTPSEAFAVLSAPTPKRPRAPTPAPVDPSTLVTEVLIMVYSSPIALPLPKGPAPAIHPARKAHRVAVLPTVREEEALDDALCDGW
ncbi:hypothetical protein B0H17DRAFT_1198587 [Mycena rosella]|uniref:Uncharacterized protein n=1 Tax=Mycena rosella TaxID=1033263 RepID=A0AAD7DN73_MYCRO|nr:hypothetical protein B0H17DRAFT_1198587 [Mycena rosella]